MKKILILNNGYGIVERGSERYTKELYNLLKNDYEVKILSAKDTGTKTRFQRRILWRNGKSYAEAYDFGKKIFKERYKFLDGGTDIILNNSGFVGSYWCKKIRHLTGIPFITLERGGGREERLNNLFKPDLISYLTKYSYDKSKYDKKVHLPIGIGTKITKRKLPEILKEKESPFILSPSALVKFKRVENTIRAFKGLKGTLIQTSDGNQDIIDFGRKHLGEHFLYTGKVSKNYLEALYQHCDLVVNASAHEAFGIVYLEAMKHNTPIVTHLDSRRKEIIGNAGYLWDCGDIDEYRNKIRDALSVDWGNIPRNQCLKYDWNKLRPKYIEAIESVSK